MTHSAWAADGNLIAIMSATVSVRAQDPSDSNESMLILADVAQQTTTMAISAMGRQERGPGPISPAGKMICWVLRTPDVIGDRAVTSED